jgi:hypothetical protein
MTHQFLKKVKLKLIPRLLRSIGLLRANFVVRSVEKRLFTAEWLCALALVQQTSILNKLNKN